MKSDLQMVYLVIARQMWLFCVGDETVWDHNAIYPTTDPSACCIIRPALPSMLQTRNLSYLSLLAVLIRYR